VSPLYSALLSWAIQLSGYSQPAGELVVAKVVHETIVQQACAGRECRVLGFYPQGGGDVVYIDDQLDPENNTFHASIVVHEMTHWLQGKSGTYGESCGESIEMEREAYSVQQGFLVRYGIYQPVFRGRFGISCK
jgi:hypothetical protein